ncbi:peroxiredoxin family protein [Brevibacillus sp. NRS-1366]|uniref:peroxiredoxin family protein n=1 Tax=Brevibacillus sp. NRS-1366 TaxID=3233899 RepID=UPI003D24744D
MKKSMIAIILLVGLVVYGGYDLFQTSSLETGQSKEASIANLETGTQKGQVAPDFSLTDLNGNEVKLADFAGKRVLVNFWATWCPPCRIEMPHMQKFYEDYQAKDVVILGVNLTPSEKNMDVVKDFVQGQQLTFPIVLDQKGEVTQTYQVVAYPTTYMLDSNGVIREKFQGAINYEVIEKAISNMK